MTVTSKKELKKMIQQLADVGMSGLDNPEAKILIEKIKEGIESIKHEALVFSDEDIKNYIDIYNKGDNAGSAEDCDQFKLKPCLVMAKAEIDRWEALSNYILVNSKLKKYFRKELFMPDSSFRRSNLSDDIDELWGMKIYYQDNVPENTAIMLSLEEDTKNFYLPEYPGRCVAVFPITEK
jgi:hypothetical protein